MIDPIPLKSVASGAGGFVIYGRDAYDGSGRSVASAGDINGDGFDDLIIGAKAADGAGNATPRSGESYVVFGHAGGFGASINLEDVAAGTGGFVIHGRDEYDASGSAVAPAGDVNGDGFDDLIIGATGADGEGDSTPTSGESYVVFGHAGGFGASLDLEDVAAGAGGFVIYGRDEGDQSGSSVASAGDVNSDGFDDLIIGAPNAAGAGNGAFMAGESYVLFGHAGGFGASIRLEDVAAGTGGFVIHGRGEYDASGSAVASAGDINGDGFDDVIIGAFHGGGASNSAGHPGASYVVYGRAGGFGASISLADVAAGTGGFVIYGREDGDRSGWSVDSAGDINGDGLDDLIIGAMSAYGVGNSTAQSGESYVVFGRAGGFGTSVNLEDVAAGTGGFVIYGRDSYDISGVSVAGAGDINGDGFDDLIVGAMAAYSADNSTPRVGESYVVFGHAGAFGASIKLEDIATGTGGFVILGRDGYDASGSSVASAGDINGDGFDDLIIGADGGAGAANGTRGAGESYVLFGRADFTLPIATDDTATVMENALPTGIVVLTNDSAGAILQSLGQVNVASPVAAITAADVTVAIQNQKIVVTPGDDFAKLAAGQNATITLPYTIRNNAGANATATLTITVTGQQGTVGNDQIDLTGVVGGVAAGGKGNDTYIVDDPADTPVELAGQGTDTVRASLSWTLGTTLENLLLTGTSGLNGTGNAANNVLTGNGGANRLDGGVGADTMSGGAGKDTLAGGLGNDIYKVGAGDVLEERAGEGTDTVKSAVGWTLAANLEKLILSGSAGVSGTGNTGDNTLTGNAAANALRGVGGADSLIGGGGNDALYGGDGKDTLSGGAGNDVLAGGTGSDKLTGGDGVDAFVFDTALNAGTNLDIVGDFQPGADKIRLDDDVFTKLGATGALAESSYHSAAGAKTAHDADDRIVYDTSTGTLYYDADGTGATPAVAFAVVSNLAAITAADFLIVA